MQDGATTPDVAGLYQFIGERVRWLRDRRGMTQEALAAAANVSRGSITQFENGQQRLPLETLYLVAFALGVGIDQLLPTVDELSLTRHDIFEQLGRDPHLSANGRIALEGFFEAAVKQEKR